MRIGKIILIIAIGLIVSFVIYTIYNSNFSDTDIKGENNFNNITKIKIGMDSSEVLGIMGPPLEKRKDKGEVYYDYDVPYGASAQCQIIFDTNGRVIYFTPIK